jgi:S-adenosylmethionine:tRNA ribosyltransferase-isomerase
LIAPTSDQPCITAQVVGITHEGGRILEIADEAAAADLATWGATPLPPYIHTALPPSQEARYQTVYARHDGSAAAPTAGLHVTPEMLEQLTARGVGRADLTLHIGIDTFRPVRADDIEAHSMHGEFITVSAQTAATIERAPGRVVAIGTTSVRALESAAQHATEGSRIAAYHGETRLFISPGYRFRIVDAILTNFHLPKSTLLMLISAFAGRDAVMNAYGQAIQHGYRFFSFGDAMLIV